MKERSFKFSRFIAGFLAALMVVTSLPETALVAKAANAEKVTFHATQDSDFGENAITEEKITTKEVTTNEGKISASDVPTVKNAPEPGTDDEFTYRFAWFLGDPESGGTEIKQEWTEVVFQDAADVYTNWIRQYTVSFDTGDENVKVESQLVDAGGKATKPDTDPERAGYTFVGWVKAASGDGNKQEFDFENTVIEAETTVYAKWTANTYTVTFSTDGGSDIASKEVTVPEVLTKPEDPTKEGYTFGGWYTDEACTTAVTWTGNNSDKLAITENTTLYAKWTGNEYTVTFDSNEGSEIVPVKVTIPDKLEKPEDPTKEGYTFEGWYTDEALETKVTWTTESEKQVLAISDNTTLYAKWEAGEYTVTFDSNGATTTPTAQTVTYPAQAVDPGTVTKAGYTFDGWYEDNKFEGEPVTFPLSVTKSITLYAKWTGNEYTATFNSNGGTAVTAQTVTLPATVKKPVDPTKEGYTFGGWYTDEELKSEVSWTGSGSNELAITQDTTLYAKWTAGVYDVIFTSNSADKTPDKQTVTYPAKAVDPGEVTKTGYTFGGWYTTSDFKGTPVTFPLSVTKDTTLYAKWNIIVVNITFNGNGSGSDLKKNSITATYGEKYTELADLEAGKTLAPERTGYTFAGWYTETACTNEIKSSDTVSAVEDFTLYAKWTAAEYNVNYVLPKALYATEADWSEATSTYNENTTRKKFAYAAKNNEINDIAVGPAIAGYTFEGWYLSADCATGKLTSTGNGDARTFMYDVSGMSADLTLYAKYTADPFEVTYDDEEDKYASSNYSTITYATRPQNAAFGSDLVISIPTRDNYDFTGFEITIGSDEPAKVDADTVAGWYDKDDLSKATKITIPKESIVGDILVETTWALTDYDITYVLNGGVNNADNKDTYNIADAKDAGKITLKEPTKIDYEFDGWYTTEKFAATSILKDNEDGTWTYQITDKDTNGLTFYASFTAESSVASDWHKVTYELDGGTNSEQNPAQLLLPEEGKTKAVTLYAPVKTGYTFGGWFWNKDLSDSTGITEAGTLTDDADTRTWSLALTADEITEGVELYAKWTIESYTITFNYNEKDTPTTKTATRIKYGTKFGDITQYKATGITKNGYTLSGYYYLDEDENKVTITEASTVEKAVELIAIWTGEEQTIVFHSAYPTAGATETTSTMVEKAGLEITMPENTFIVPAGYTFKGWSAANDGSEDDDLAPGEKYEITPHPSANAEKNNVIDIYAIWDVDTYYVIFDIGDGVETSAINTAKSSFKSIKKQEVGFEGKTYTGVGHLAELMAGDQVTLTGEEFVRDGYTLENWTSSKGGTVENGTIQSLATKNGEVVILSANWALDNYSIKFVTNGGIITDEESPAVKTLSAYNATTLKESVKLPTPKKDGYDFAGWYKTADLYDEDKENRDTISVGGDMYSATLYAKYTPTKYKIAFYKTSVEGATPIYTTDEMVYGDSVKVSKVLSDYKKEFAIDGRDITGVTVFSAPAKYSDIVGTTYKTTDTLKNLITDGEGGVVSIRPIYSGVSYKIKYNLAGGKQTGAKTTYTSGEAFTIPTEPTKNGYVFEGWKSNSDTVTLDAATSRTIQASSYGAVTLTAQWSGINVDITVVDPDTETSVSDRTEAYGANINLAESATALQAAAGKDVPVAKFYWMNGKKKVNFTLNKYYNTTKFGKDALNGEVTLYAVWAKAGTFNINYEIDDTNDSDTGLAANDVQKYPRTYTVKKVAKFPTPKKTGYVFTGWSGSFNAESYTTPIKTSAKLIKAIKAQKKEATDITLVPNFSKVTYKVSVLPNASGVKAGEESVTNKTPYDYGEVEYADTNSVISWESVGYWYRKGYSFKGFATDKKGKKMLTKTVANASPYVAQYDISELATKNGKKVKVYAIWDSAAKFDIIKSYGISTVVDEKSVIATPETAYGLGDSLTYLKSNLEKAGWKMSDEWATDEDALTYGKALNLSKPSIAGYTFAGWVAEDVDEDYNSLKTSKAGYVTAVNKTNAADVTLRAVFVPNTFTVKFDYNGGYYYNAATKQKENASFDIVDSRDNKIGYDCNLVADLTFAKGDAQEIFDITEIKGAQKDGYVLAGFAYDAAGKLDVSTYRFTPKAKSVVTIYPIWADPEIKTVTATATGKTIKVDITGNSAAVSYEVQYSDTIGFRKTTTQPVVDTVKANADKTAVSTKTMTGTGDHYVRVRSVVTDPAGEKTYGEWSTIQQVTCTSGI